MHCTASAVSFVWLDRVRELIYNELFYFCHIGGFGCCHCEIHSSVHEQFYDSVACISGRSGTLQSFLLVFLGLSRKKAKSFNYKIIILHFVLRLMLSFNEWKISNESLRFLPKNSYSRRQMLSSLVVFNPLFAVPTILVFLMIKCWIIGLHYILRWHARGRIYN